MLLPAGRLGCAISPMLACCFAVMSSSVATARGAGAVVVIVSSCVGGAGRGRCWSVVELREGVGEGKAGEFAVADDRGELRDLAGPVGPGLVAREQDAIGPDATALDLRDEPPRSEADGPGQVGVDALARLHPVEEATAGELDVAAHPATEVDEVQGHRVGVAVDEGADLIDVAGRTGGGVDVDDEAVFARG